MISKNTKEYIKNKKDQNLFGVDFVGTLHPGVTLQDELDFFGITQKEVAKKIGYSVQTINRIIKGRESINTDIALALERVFDGRPKADFWLNMQMDYNKELLKNREFKEVKEEIEYFKENIKETFKELQKGAVFEDYVLKSKDSYKKAVIQIKDFFGSSVLSLIKTENLLGVPFRKYERKKINLFNLSAILKIGEKKARNILRENFISPYDEKVFSEKVEDLKKLSNQNQEDFLEILKERCLEMGVVLIYVPNMTNTHFGGATIWVGSHPVILLKVENQREDIFWFNFFHEVGHILKHSKKDISINFEEKEVTEKTELEANDYAENILIPNFDEVLKTVEKGLTTEKWIDSISKKTGVSKSIVAGRLCNIVSFGDVWKKLSQYRPVIKTKISFV